MFEKHVIPEAQRQQTAAPWIEDNILFFNPWAFNLSDMPEQQSSRIIISTPPSQSLTQHCFSPNSAPWVLSSNARIERDVHPTGLR